LVEPFYTHWSWEGGGKRLARHELIMFFVSSEVTGTLALRIIFFVSGVGVVAGAVGRERRTGRREEMHEESGHRPIV
jgi:hypothetical protein